MASVGVIYERCFPEFCSARRTDGTALTKRRCCICEPRVLRADACGWRFSTTVRTCSSCCAIGSVAKGITVRLCATQMVAELAHAHVEVEQFISEHKPDVVVYDVPMPYGSSWDLLDVIRSMPSLRSLPFVITTRNKRKLEEVVGHTSAIEIAGQPEDMRRLLRAVEAAGASASGV